MEISEAAHKNCQLEEIRQYLYKVYLSGDLQDQKLLGVIRFWFELGKLDPRVEIFQYISDLCEFKYLEEVTFEKNGTTIIYPATLPRALWRAQNVLYQKYKEEKV